MDVKKNRAQKIMVVQEREWSEKERMEKKQWLKGFFAVDLQENVIIVAFQSFFGATFEYGGVEVFGVEFQYIHQILPCPGDGFLLEVVAKRPVIQ